MDVTLVGASRAYLASVQPSVSTCGRVGAAGVVVLDAAEDVLHRTQPPLHPIQHRAVETF